MSWVSRRLLRGEPPSVREVQEAFGFRSVESARAHLEALVEEGRLRKLAGQARGYRLPGRRRKEALRVPLVGRVAAGGLELAVEEAEGWLAVAGRSRGDGLFALRVAGQSMRDAGIRDGDVVVVKRQRTARSGAIVVALVEDEATVKTLRRRGREVVLQPENPDFDPIVRPASEVTILGQVVEVRRWLDGRVPLEDAP